MSVFEPLKKEICLPAIAKKFIGHDIFKKKSFWRVAVLLIFVFFCLYDFPYIYGKKTDDSSFYIASRGILSGTNIYNENEFYRLGDELFGKSVEFWPYLYSPILAELLVPLASKSYGTFTIVWFILNMILGFACPLLTIYAVKGQRKTNRLLQIFLLFLCVFSYPFRNTLIIGQVNFFVYFMIVMSIFFYKNKKSFWSAFFLSTATLIKTFPIIYLLYFFVIKDFKYIKQFILNGITIMVSSVLLFGSEIWAKYFSFALNNVVNPAPNTPINLYYLGYQNNFSPRNMLVQIFDSVNLPISNIKIIFPIMVLAVLAISFHTLFKAEHNTSFSFSLLSLTYLMISPICWRHHYILIAMPLIYILSTDRGDKLLVNIVILLASLIIFYYPLWTGFPFNTIIFISAITAYLVLLFIKDKSYDSREHSALVGGI